MTYFNPDFWEVTLSEDRWKQFADEDHPFYEAPDDVEARQVRAEQARQMLPEVQAIIDAVLTDRQAEVGRLYFFEQLNQRQIGERLGISQQGVSEHLYGKVRNGKSVGGALRKLRKACAKRGGSW